jgi:radical SAM PhpK family P-methyltransferase
VLKDNMPLEQVNNIFYKTNSDYKSTPISRENNQLSENMVNWELFSQRVGNFAAIRTAISCPFSCAFCGFPEHAGPYQTAEVQKIEQELNCLEKIKKVKSILFIDDTFNIPAGRFKEILKMMLKQNFTFKWHSYFRCQFANKETVEMMENSGCEGVFLGLESGSEKILKNMNKQVKLDEYYRGIQLLKEHRIITYGNFIIGFPGETYETVEETLQFIKKSGLDFYRAQLWYCEPITPIWKEREKYYLKGESFEWNHSTMTASRAADLVEKIFLTLEKEAWVPQYNFDFENIWHLKHRGMSIETIKNFLKAFNSGIEEKLTSPTQKEISYQVIKRLKNYRMGSSDINDSLENSKSKINHSDAELVF